MKKNDCNVIRDLMPLVLDRVASDESRGLVEEHMETCEECRKEYEKMKADMPQETLAEYEEEQRTIVEALKTTRATQRKRKRRKLILVFAVAFVAVMAAGFLMTWLDQGYWPVNNEKYTMSLSRLKNGEIVVTMDLKFNSSFIGSTTRNVEEDGKNILYVSVYVPPLRYIYNGENHGKSCWSVWKDSDLPDEIRQGQPGNYVTVWKKGDPIPDASEEMEKYVEMERKVNSLYEVEEVFSSRELDELEAAVPEWH